MEIQQVENQEAVAIPKRTIMHKLFGSTPGDGELQPKEGMSYSIAGFGQNLVCTIIGSYLTVFMTDAIGYNALWVALLMLFARLFDAFNDPIMGSIVDKTRTPWGKCRPYLKWMALPVALMSMLCFLPVYPNNPGGFAAISIVYILWGVVYTVVDVPYWGLSTAMSNDTYKRGNLLTVARLICTAGAGLVTIIVPQVTAQMTADMAGQVKGLQELVLAGTASVEQIAQLAGLQASISHDLSWIYFVVAAICVTLAVPMFYLGFKNTKERNQSLGAPPTLKHNLKLLGKNKPLKLVVASGVLGAAKMAFTYTGGLYFAKYVLADVAFLGMRGEALYTLITMAVVPGGLIASLMVPYCTKKFGKRNTYIWSHIIGGIAMMIAFIVGISISRGNYSDTATLVVALLALLIAGVPSGFGNIISYAMIGDTVEYLELKTGERAEGICFAMQTFINKIGMAVGAFIGVLGYYIAGITPNNPGALSASGKDVMWIMLMLLGALSMIGTAIPLFFYKFNEKEQLEAAAIIKERKSIAELNAGVDSAIDGNDTNPEN